NNSTSALSHMAFATWTPYSPASNETIATLISDFLPGEARTNSGIPRTVAIRLSSPAYSARFSRTRFQYPFMGVRKLPARQQWAMTAQLQRSAIGDVNRR